MSNRRDGVVRSSNANSLVALPGLQVNPGMHKDAVKLAAYILQTEGIQGFYGGLKASMLKVLPMAMLSFGTYETVRMLLTTAGDKAVGQHALRESMACKKSI